MQTRTTRRGIPLTALGFGTAPLAGMFTPVSDEQAAATLDAAWEAGFRYFDTAPHYGLGLAEQQIRQCLRHLLSAEPGLQHGSRIVGPVELQRRA